MPIIFSTHPLHPQASAMLAPHGSLKIATAPDAATLLAEGQGADIIIVRASLPPALFDPPGQLRAAIRHGAGLDMIPLDAATAAGVLVANAPGANARSVAEYATLGILTLLRRFRQVDRDLRAQGWNAGRDHANFAHDLNGLCVGIVGMGNIGREVFRIMHHGFGLEVITSTPRPERIPPPVRAVGIDQLVAESDIVILCCPLNAETRGLLGASHIGRMKPGAIIVNVSRGQVMDEEALLGALQAGRIGGAVLDVFSSQPLPRDHPLFRLDNVLLTPHLAGITAESMLRMGKVAASEAILVLQGQLPVNLCNTDAVARYRQRFPEPAAPAG